MAKKWCLAIDISRCSGCGSCELSVQDEYTGNNYPGFSAPVPDEGVHWLWLKEYTYGHGTKIKRDYVPVMFPHDRNFDPSDIPGCPEGAVYVREDGLTIIDPEKAKGCKAIYEYFEKKYPRTVFWNEELQLPQTYIMDAHRLDEGEKLPRCVEDCPNQAMHWGDLNDPESDVSKFIAEHEGQLEDFFPADNGEDYVVRYYRIPKPFIAGEVITADGECAEHVRVTLTDKDGNVSEMYTDFFGDLEFQRLEMNETYTVTVDAPGAEPITVLVDESKNLGEISISLTRDELLAREGVK